MAIVLLPDLALRISADKLLSASIRVSFYYPVSIWRSARDLRRQQAQGVPKACKKAGFAPTGAVCRSGTRQPVHSRASPTRRENRPGFPGSRTRRRHLAGRVPRAKRLGRSKRSEIPVQETCTRRSFVKFIPDFTKKYNFFYSDIDKRELLIHNKRDNQNVLIDI